MKEYTQAADALQEVRSIPSHPRFTLSCCEQAKAADVDGKNKTEIANQERKCTEAMFSQDSDETDEQRVQRAMRDPAIGSY